MAGLDATWDDPSFECPTLQADPDDEEQDAYVAPREPEWDAQHDLDWDRAGGADSERPVLLLNLTALAAQLDQGNDGAAKLRAQVIDALNANFVTKSAELLSSGLCWHSVQWRCAADRAEREAELADGSLLTVLPYPELIDGVPVEAMWARICRPTAWEVVDVIKGHVADCHRDLRWKVEVGNEVEEMAEREMCLLERRRTAASKVRSLQSERLRALDALHTAREGCGGEVPERALRSMLGMLHNLEKHLAEAEGEHAAAAEDGGDEAAEDEPSAVDLMLGMVFQSAARAPAAPGGAGGGGAGAGAGDTGGTGGGGGGGAGGAAALADGLAWRAATQRDLRRMWHATFGRLPAASRVALKHRIGSGAQRPTPGGGGGAPRMLVPPPIPLGALSRGPPGRPVGVTREAE